MRRQFVVASALMVFFCLLGLLLGRIHPAPWGDGLFYFEMANAPFKYVGSPYGYRIGVPYSAALLSSVFGVDLVASFAAVRLVAFASFMTVLCLWMLNGLQLRRLIVGLAAALFLFSPGATYNLYNMWVIGFAELLFVLVGVIAIYHCRFGILMWVVAVSALFKESVGLVLIPSYLFSEAASRQWGTLVRNTLLLLLAFASVFLLLRSGVIFYGNCGLDSYASFYSAGYLREVYNSWGGLLGAGRLILLAFGPVWLLAVWGVRRAPSRFRPLAVLPVLAVFQILLATDVERMLAVGSPVLVVFCAFALSAVPNVRAVLISAACCLYGAVHFVLPAMSIVAFLASSVVVLVALMAGRRCRPSWSKGGSAAI